MLLHTEHLTGGYRDHPVIHDLHLTLQPGEWLSLIGANGSGKSTLLKLLNRLLIPQQGVVWLDGKAIHSLPAQSVAQTLA
jgi:iron complex transport system ATP-binding protein